MTDTCFVSVYNVFFLSVRHKSLYVQLLLPFQHDSLKFCMHAYYHMENRISLHYFDQTIFEELLPFLKYFSIKKTPLIVSYMWQINGISVSFTNKSDILYYTTKNVVEMALNTSIIYNSYSK